MNFGYLMNFSIEREAEIFLRPRSPDMSKVVRVVVLTFDGRNYPLFIKPSKSVECLKYLISLYAGVLEIKQHLFFKGKITYKITFNTILGTRLESGKLENNGIKDGSAIFLYQNLTRNQYTKLLQIKVQMGGSTVAKIPMFLSDTIDCMKKMIRDETGISIRKQQLIFEGKLRSKTRSILCF
jgi:hypothetical protein